MRQRPEVTSMASAAVICLGILSGILSTGASAAGDNGASPVVSIDFLAGEWRILDTEGKEIGHSTIAVQVPGAMLFEVRKIGDRGPQSLWLMNSEKHGGWTQLFIGPKGAVREFPPQSRPGAWPLVTGAPVTLQSGENVVFRMAISRKSDDQTRRVLEMSADNGATWKTVFDYTYVRAAQ